MIIVKICTFIFILGISLNASNKIVATVNGENVTMSDVNSIVRAMGGSYFSILPKEKRDIVIQQAIQKKLLKQQALKEKIEEDSLYKEALKVVKDKLMLEVWMKKKFTNIKVSDEEIKKYYEANIDKYKKNEQVKARHIVLNSKKEADEIIAILDKTPKKELQKEFIKLAKAKSIGPSASKGGDLGWFDKTKMASDFTKASFALNQGEYTKKPIKTDFGFHVIYLDGKLKPFTIALKDISSTIAQKIKKEKFNKEIDKELIKLKNSAKIEYKN